MERISTLSLLVALALPAVAVADDPLQPYRDAFRHYSTIEQQARSCQWGEPFAAVMLNVAAENAAELAEARFGQGSGAKVKADFKPVAKPCGSAEDATAQAMAGDVMFEWANRMAAMKQVMEHEAWARDIVDISAGINELESWRAGAQQQAIAARGQAAWEGYARQIQLESLHELAMVCPERAMKYYKGKRACPTLDPAMAAATPLARVRIEDVEWLSPKLAKLRDSFERGAVGSPYAFIDTNPETMPLQLSGFTFELDQSACANKQWVIYPAARDFIKHPDGTIDAVLRRFNARGVFGTLKLKPENLNYVVVSADARAQSEQVVEGKFTYCPDGK